MQRTVAKVTQNLLTAARNRLSTLPTDTLIEQIENGICGNAGSPIDSALKAGFDRFSDNLREQNPVKVTGREVQAALRKALFELEETTTNIADAVRITGLVESLKTETIPKVLESEQGFYSTILALEPVCSVMPQIATFLESTRTLLQQSKAGAANENLLEQVVKIADRVNRFSGLLGRMEDIGLGYSPENEPLRNFQDLIRKRITGLKSIADVFLTKVLDPIVDTIRKITTIESQLSFLGGMTPIDSLPRVFFSQAVSLALEGVLPAQMKREMNLERLDGHLVDNREELWNRLSQLKDGIRSSAETYGINEEQAWLFSDRDRRIPIFHMNQTRANGVVGVMTLVRDKNIEISIASPFGKVECFVGYAKDSETVAVFLKQLADKFGLTKISGGPQIFSLRPGERVCYQTALEGLGEDGAKLEQRAKEYEISSDVLKALWRSALSKRQRINLGQTFVHEKATALKKLFY